MPSWRKIDDRRPFPRSRLRRYGAAGSFAALCLALTALSGCASISGAMGAKIKAYDGPERSDSQVATILKAAFLKDTPAMVGGVDGVSYGSTLEGYPWTVKVLPGSHRLRIYCNAIYARGYVEMTAIVQAGKTYRVGCSVANYAFLRGAGEYPAEGTITEVPPGG